MISEIRERLRGRTLWPSPPPGAYEIEITDLGIWSFCVSPEARVELIDGPSADPKCRMTCVSSTLRRILSGTAVDIIYSFTFFKVRLTDLRYAPYYQLLLESDCDASNRMSPAKPA